MNNKYGAPIVNIFTILIFMCACLTGGIYVAILANPRLPINPFPPPVQGTVLVLPSLTPTSAFSNLLTVSPTKAGTQGTVVASPTLVVVPSTSTRTPQGGQPPTTTLTPSMTPTITPTSGVVQVTTTGTPSTSVAATTTPFPTSTTLPTNTITPTPTRTLSAFTYIVQEGSPIALENIFNSKGCAWMGVIGQAFELDTSPRFGLIVHVEGGGISIDAFTGSNTKVGPAGYEIQLSDHPIQTVGTYKVQLRDGGFPLSDVVTLSTSSDCKRNAIMLNFVRVR